MGKNVVVIVAAGRGERMGGVDGPKQYRLIAGKSLLQHTIDCFLAHKDIHAIQTVIHSDDVELFDASVATHEKLLAAVVGGETRQESCKAGVDALEGQGFEKILIHDAARPFVSNDIITNVLAGVSQGICALPASAIADTIKRADYNKMVINTVERNNLYLAQTPQGFLFDDAIYCHNKAAEANRNDFTDDAAVAEWAGLSTRLVEGGRNNFKITTKDDLLAAEQRLAMTEIPDIRAGNGYDVHTLGPGTSVILCGVEIPHTKSLQGHSDADVGLHSLTDALLGTIGAGDIGSHFPPSDDQWKDASSDQFLQHAVKLVKNKGGTITNLDVTIICEAPKIGPHRDIMREKVAEICAVEIDRVSVKATTNEKIGFIGREEGIAALAAATVVFQK